MYKLPQGKMQEKMMSVHIFVELMTETITVKVKLAWRQRDPRKKMVIKIRLFFLSGLAWTDRSGLLDVTGVLVIWPFLLKHYTALYTSFNGIIPSWCITAQIHGLSAKARELFTGKKQILLQLPWSSIETATMAQNCSMPACRDCELSALLQIWAEQQYGEKNS